MASIVIKRYRNDKNPETKVLMKKNAMTNVLKRKLKSN